LISTFLHLTSDFDRGELRENEIWAERAIPARVGLGERRSIQTWQQVDENGAVSQVRGRFGPTITAITAT
jgi:hypothetical protein